MSNEKYALRATCIEKNGICAFTEDKAKIAFKSLDIIQFDNAHLR